MVEFIKTPPRNLAQRDRLSWRQFTAAESRYDAMPYRGCGASGLQLPAITLGAWEAFGGYRGLETARKCIFRAFNLGITHFDFANNYGRAPGRAETVVDRVLRGSLRAPAVTSAPIGASSVEQVEENVKALAQPGFAAEELTRIDQVLKS